MYEHLLLGGIYQEYTFCTAASVMFYEYDSKWVSMAAVTMPFLLDARRSRSLLLYHENRIILVLV